MRERERGVSTTASVKGILSGGGGVGFVSEVIRAVQVGAVTGVAATALALVVADVNLNRRSSEEETEKKGGGGRSGRSVWRWFLQAVYETPQERSEHMRMRTDIMSGNTTKKRSTSSSKKKKKKKKKLLRTGSNLWQCFQLAGRALPETSANETSGIDVADNGRSSNKTDGSSASSVKDEEEVSSSGKSPSSSASQVSPTGNAKVNATRRASSAGDAQHVPATTARHGETCSSNSRRKNVGDDASDVHDDACDTDAVERSLARATGEATSSSPAAHIDAPEVPSGTMDRALANANDTLDGGADKHERDVRCGGGEADASGAVVEEEEVVEEEVNTTMNSYDLQQAVIEAVSFLRHKDDASIDASDKELVLRRWIAIIAAPRVEMPRFEAVLRQIADTETIPLTSNADMKMALLRGSIPERGEDGAGEDAIHMNSDASYHTQADADTNEDIDGHTQMVQDGQRAWKMRSARFQKRFDQALDSLVVDKGGSEDEEPKSDSDPDLASLTQRRKNAKMAWKLRSARFKRRFEEELDSLFDVQLPTTIEEPASCDSADGDSQNDDYETDIEAKGSARGVTTPRAIWNARELRVRTEALKRRVTEELEAMENGIPFTHLPSLDEMDAEEDAVALHIRGSTSGRSFTSLGESLDEDAFCDAVLAPMPPIDESTAIVNASITTEEHQHHHIREKQFDDACRQLAMTLDGIERRRTARSNVSADEACDRGDDDRDDQDDDDDDNRSTLSGRAAPLKFVNVEEFERITACSAAPELTLGGMLEQAGRQLETMRSELDLQECELATLRAQKATIEEKHSVLLEKYKIKEVENSMLANRADGDEMLMTEHKTEILSLKGNLEDALTVGRDQAHELALLRAKIETYEEDIEARDKTMHDSACMLEIVRDETVQRDALVTSLQETVTSLQAELQDVRDENDLLQTQAEAAANLAKRAIGAVRTISTDMDTEAEKEGEESKEETKKTKAGAIAPPSIPASDKSLSSSGTKKARQYGRRGVESAKPHSSIVTKHGPRVAHSSTPMGAEDNRKKESIPNELRFLRNMQQHKERLSSGSGKTPPSRTKAARSSSTDILASTPKHTAQKGSKLISGLSKLPCRLPARTPPPAPTGSGTSAFRKSTTPKLPRGKLATTSDA